MSYFVTGATGFIGRNLVELLLEREGTIYVLVREGSRAGSRSCARVGRRRGPRRRRRRRPVRARASGSPEDGLARARGQGRPPLPPRGDLRHDRRRRDASGSRTSRAPATWSSSPTRSSAGRVHMVSSIAAAGLYKGTWREDMFEEAQKPRQGPLLPHQARVRGRRAQRVRSGRGASTGRASSSATRRPARWTRSTGPTTSSS